MNEYQKYIQTNCVNSLVMSFLGETVHIFIFWTLVAFKSDPDNEFFSYIDSSKFYEYWIEMEVDFTKMNNKKCRKQKECND